MKSIQIELNMEFDNAQFYDDETGKVFQALEARLALREQLFRMAENIDLEGHKFSCDAPVRDDNGNTIGDVLTIGVNQAGDLV